MFYVNASARILLHGIRARGLKSSTADTKNLRENRVKFHLSKKEKTVNMDRGMGSSLPTEKLDRSNYASWLYKMHQHLLDHGYWSYVEGANDIAPESTHKDFSAWEQASSRVLYCLVTCVNDQLLSYIRDAKTPKDAWGNL